MFCLSQRPSRSSRICVAVLSLRCRLRRWAIESDEGAINHDRNDKPFQRHQVGSPRSAWSALLPRCGSICFEYSQHRAERQDISGAIERRRV